MKTSQAQLPLPNEVLLQPSIKQRIAAALKRVSQALQASFIGSSELRIWQTYDEFGETWWHVYDPVTGRQTCVNTETELRAWIEMRYYK